MVALRGLLGRRGSVAADGPQHRAEHRLGHDGDHRHLHRGGRGRRRRQWRWPFVIFAGAVATLMAVRPLGSVRLLRKVMVWLVLAASVFLFVEVLMRPRQPIPQDGVLGFWPAVDLAVAGVVSFAPLAADYSRHSRTRRAAFWGASLGYGLAAVAYYTLGVFAVANLGASDVITAPGDPPGGCHRPRDLACRRGGRGVRQRLLDDDVGAEPVPAAWIAGSSRVVIGVIGNR